MTANTFDDMTGKSGWHSLHVYYALSLLLLLLVGQAQSFSFPELRLLRPKANKLSKVADQPRSNLPNVPTLLMSKQCKPLTSDYQMLIDRLLFPFKGNLTVADLLAMHHKPSATVYIKKNRMYVDVTEHDEKNLMITTLLDSIQRITQKVTLPDLVMVINGADEPAGILQPLFSFCRHSTANNDLLIANAVEGALTNGLREDHFTPSRFGEEDGRKSAIIWYGRPHAWDRGQRHALARLGTKHPGIVHTGITDFSGLPEDYTKEHQEEFDKFKKEGMWILEWADHYKYQLNIAGNCGSSRLAYQLYTDTALFWVSLDDEEWYYPLLRPYVHYIPVEVKKDGDTDLVAQRRWAENNPKIVEQIVKESTEFAVKHLIPDAGYDCYLPMLLQQYSELFVDLWNMTIPDAARTFPFPESS